MYLHSIRTNEIAFEFLWQLNNIEWQMYVELTKSINRHTHSHIHGKTEVERGTHTHTHSNTCKFLQTAIPVMFVHITNDLKSVKISITPRPLSHRMDRTKEM